MSLAERTHGRCSYSALPAQRLNRVPHPISRSCFSSVIRHDDHPNMGRQTLPYQVHKRGPWQPTATVSLDFPEPRAVIGGPAATAVSAEGQPTSRQVLLAGTRPNAKASRSGGCTIDAGLESGQSGSRWGSRQIVSGLSGSSRIVNEEPDAACGHFLNRACCCVTNCWSTTSWNTAGRGFQQVQE